MNGPVELWLDLLLLLPLFGAVWLLRLQDPDEKRRHALFFCGATLFCSLVAWLQFAAWKTDAVDQWSLISRLLQTRLFAIDSLNAPLLPLAALLNFLTVLVIRDARVQHISFVRMLVSETILLATLSCMNPTGIVVLLALGTIPPWHGLRALHKPTRIYLVHAALFLALLAGSEGAARWGNAGQSSQLAIVLLAIAILMRSGVVPLHCWLTDLFEHAHLGTAMLFTIPIVGAYAAVRLILPSAPDWLLQVCLVWSLITAVYSAGMALVQREARRLFCYLFLSNSSLVFVGLETATSLSLTGALCAWFSVALSLAGFGLTLRSLESRIGRIRLDEFHGLFEHTPSLAVLFLITGLASIGFPGTAGFIGTELLVESAVSASPFIGIAIVTTATLNGLAVLYAYFQIFTGKHHPTTIDLASRPAEKAAVLVLLSLILGGGLFPQPGVISRYEYARQWSKKRHPNSAASVNPRPADVTSHRLASAPLK